MDEVQMPSESDREHPVASGQPDDRISLRTTLDATMRLAEDQRVVLELVAIEGLTYDEVSRVVGIPVGTVMSRLSRGRERLRDMLDAPAAVHLRRVK